VVALALLSGAVGAGCGGGTEERADARPPQCPPAWLAGWQRLADRVGATVFCPRWMPNPLTAEIGGEWDNGVSVRSDRSYLVSFLWHEHGNDVHVNFRGYPGRTRIPSCADADRRGESVPCFRDPEPARRVGRFTATLYRVNDGVDQWHLLYAWRHRGTLYTLSEHVAPPYSSRRVRENLNRLVDSLVAVSPAA
jgi:hypothetical protein